MKRWLRNSIKGAASGPKPLLCFGCESSLGGKASRPAEKTEFGKHIHASYSCRRKALQRYLKERGVMPS